jgi:choline-sulfatase
MECFMSNEQPNIVYLFSDQHRHDAMGCAGNNVVQTPALDRLAGEGVRFERTYCQSPLCMPSRASVITGLYPHQHGILQNFVKDLNPQWPNMMKQLQKAGYFTSLFGKTHFFSAGLKVPENGVLDLREKEDLIKSFGFDVSVEEFDRYVHCFESVLTPYTEYLKSKGNWQRYADQIKAINRITPHHWDGVTSPLDQEDDLTSFIADRSMDWLKGYNGEKPFFMMTSFVAPHVPLMGDPIWAEYYQDKDIELGPRTAPDIPNKTWGDFLALCQKHSHSELLTDAYVKAGARQYYAMISLIDQKISEIVAMLEEKGILENTWILYSADHGELLGDHNLMAKLNFYKSSVQVPAIIRPPKGMAGKVESGLTESIDLTATILDIAGADPLERSSGNSLLPFISGEGKPKEAAFSAIDFARYPDRSYMMTATDRYRYTLESESWTPCEFFDLQEDPDELNNLVNDASVQGLMKDMDADLVRPYLATE